MFNLQAVLQDLENNNFQNAEKCLLAQAENDNLVACLLLEFLYRTHLPDEIKLQHWRARVAEVALTQVDHSHIDESDSEYSDAEESDSEYSDSDSSEIAEPDPNESVLLEWFTQQADGKNATGARFMSVFMTLHGIGTIKNKDKALDLLKELIAQDYTPAFVTLGWMYASGLITSEGNSESENQKEAFQWYMRAALKGYAGGQNNVGLCYYQKKGIPEESHEEESDKKAFEYFSLAAKQEATEAQYNLGIMHLENRGLPEKNDPKENEKKAFEYFQLAAEKRHAAALYKMGEVYFDARSVPNDKKAFECFSLAVRGNLVPAYYYLGLMHLAARGVPEGSSQEKNNKKAFKYIRLAAENNIPQAQYLLGVLYSESHGVLEKNSKVENEEGKFKYWKLAAEKGYIEAQNALAYAFIRKAKVEQNIQTKHENLKEAFKYFGMSAEQGNAEGLTYLGLMYLDGSGVEKNIILGLTHLFQGMLKENSRAKETLKNYLTLKPISSETMAEQPIDLKNILEKVIPELMLLVGMHSDYNAFCDTIFHYPGYHQMYVNLLERVESFFELLDSAPSFLMMSIDINEEGLKLIQSEKESDKKVHFFPRFQVWAIGEQGVSWVEKAAQLIDTVEGEKDKIHSMRNEWHQHLELQYDALIECNETTTSDIAQLEKEFESISIKYQKLRGKRDDIVKEQDKLTKKAAEERVRDRKARVLAHQGMYYYNLLKSAKDLEISSPNTDERTEKLNQPKRRKMISFEEKVSQEKELYQAFCMAQDSIASVITSHIRDSDRRIRSKLG